MCVIRLLLFLLFTSVGVCYMADIKMVQARPLYHLFSESRTVQQLLQNFS